ncbi:hypothetical protein CC80DRAFT_543879 [Byssothecium circinans]|uniref:Uncharacterized protein n=1 Tax=Byssothecium circinans TaxID=147558 RepID=A0A6A5UKE6_9PLEO|nr:hypothetical protein CC80DRAFT_543879 [Byssothecium circinans]
MLQHMREEAGPNVSQEILDEMKARAVSSVVTDHKAQIAERKTQIKKLYDSGTQNNKHIWPVMLKPGKYFMTKPSLMGFSTVEEMQIKLQYNYNT